MSRAASEISRALQCHQSGQFSEAEEIYRNILFVDPQNANALHLLGVLTAQRGQTAEGIDLIERAIAINPNVADYHANLAEIHRRLGRPRPAIELLEKAIALAPPLAHLHNNLGVALHDDHRLLEAAAEFQKAIAIDPEFAAAHGNLANVLREQGLPDAAIAAARKAVALNPKSASAHNNLGVALRAAGETQAAADSFRVAMELAPDSVEAQTNLGNIYHAQRQPAAALAACRRAVQLDPQSAAAHNNLANVLRDLGQFDEAADEYRAALNLKFNDFDARRNLALLKKEQGDLDASIALLREAIRLNPDSSLLQQDLLYTLNFHPDYDAAAISAASRDWAQRFAPRRAVSNYSNDRTRGRRLKVGYVSPDFRAHPAASFLLPLLESHDPLHVEVICYSGVLQPDEITRRCMTLAHGWRNTVGLNDAQLIQHIRDDQIDILVDLTLHMTGNRLTVFAARPAPVQVTWLGYPGTTGMDAIDYRISDPHLDPPEIAADFAEKTVRLPHSFWCYRPYGATPEMNTLPAIAAGHITFGCFNNFGKITRPALELWAQTLAAIPGSRFKLLAPQGSARNLPLHIFQSFGIDLDRIDLLDRAEPGRYFSLYHQIDLALDPMPYPGHTSALDGLWMGVPAITLAGNTPAARGGASILRNVHLDGYVATTPREYIQAAQAAAADPVRLALLRKRLRTRLIESPLGNARQFTADLESLYGKLWKYWLDQ